MKFSIMSMALAAVSTVATPLKPRATELSCGSWAELTEGDYTLYHNNWGSSYATSGSQCTYFTSYSDDVIAWYTTWTWVGGSTSVKSYSNAALMDINKQLSSVSSIPSTWKWSYDGSDIDADVSYDLWLSKTSGGDDVYEIMVWLAAYGGAGPISSSGSAIATVKIGCNSFKLYSGTNGSTTVYSFVATSTITNFSADMMDFFNYLVENEGVSDSYYITHLQAGTEPFTGTDCTFTVSSYSMTVE